MRSQDVVFESGNVRLAGTIMLPDGRGSFPGVVLIGGSGPSDRHNGGFFDILSGHLVASGVAVLAYDKRGAGRSTGRWDTATIDELAADGDAACTALQARAAVSGAVRVLGHSEGGWVAMRLCSRLRPETPVVLNSSSAVSFIDAEQFALTAAGASADAAAAGASILRAMARAADAGADLAHGRRIFARAQSEPWYATVEASGFALDEMTWSVLGSWGLYDPLDDLCKLTSPTLVVLGADDPLVPVEASVARYQSTARNTRRTQELVIFPDADHRLHLPGGGLPSRYLSKLSDWLLQPDG